jgi:two-component system cell cycle sensor histidine kinase/response regulator CckA
MKESVSLLRAALDALKEPLFILDTQRQCVFANQSFFSFLHLTPPKGVGSLPLQDFWPEALQADLTQDEIRCDWSLRTGEAFSVKLQVYQLGDQLGGGETAFRVVAGGSKNELLTDFRTQRLETLGLLASGVAHDFNNVLTGILGHVTYLKTILPPKGPHTESLKAIEEGARKATSISQQILSFSKIDPAEATCHVDLGDLTARTVSLLRGAISPEFSLQYKAPAKALCLLGVEGRIAQIIVNLAINARDALETGGQIDIEVRLCQEAERLRRVFGNSELPCAAYVVLGVRDDGHGMSQEVMDRMFEPYFSTKKEKGTGLGLSTVAAIVRQMGGAIEVVSEMNVGSEINVYFPMLEESVETVAESKPEHKPLDLQRGSERILIIDDEYSVRNVLSLSLQHLGYEVEVAASGTEALELYQRSPSGFDLILLDMLMPQMSGDKVYFRLKELNPSIKVLLISGFASEDAIQSVLRSGGLGFIQKPFTIDELAKQVRKCFQAAS